MGKDVAQVYPVAGEVFDHANEILGFDLKTLCFDGPPERLNATDISQPAIFVTSVAIYRVLKDLGVIESENPQAMAGLSLGEYTALHLAGWLNFEDCLRLVAERGRLMQVASEASPSGMVSIIGLDEPKAEELCRQAAGGGVLVPANFNCPGQIAISGDKDACDRALEIADLFEARAVPLTVAGAFHSPLMESAAQGLKPVLASSKMKTGRIGVVSNVSADYHADPDNVRALLHRQVAKPIRWQASIERLIAQGFDRFVEIGPGKVLTGLMRRINRSVKAVNFSSAESIEKGVACLGV